MPKIDKKEVSGQEFLLAELADLKKLVRQTRSDPGISRDEILVPVGPGGWPQNPFFQKVAMEECYALSISLSTARRIVADVGKHFEGTSAVTTAEVKDAVHLFALRRGELVRGDANKPTA